MTVSVGERLLAILLELRLRERRRRLDRLVANGVSPEEALHEVGEVAPLPAISREKPADFGL